MQKLLTIFSKFSMILATCFGVTGGKAVVLFKRQCSNYHNCIPRFAFVDWAELLEACHSMSRPNSAQEKSVQKHPRGLLCIIVRLIMACKHYRSAQMTR